MFLMLTFPSTEGEKLIQGIRAHKGKGQPQMAFAAGLGLQNLTCVICQILGPGNFLVFPK